MYAFPSCFASRGLASLWHAHELCDTRLIAEDGHVDAHRVVLAACSGFFRARFVGAGAAMSRNGTCVTLGVGTGTGQLGTGDSQRGAGEVEEAGWATVSLQQYPVAALTLVVEAMYQGHVQVSGAVGCADQGWL